jgi:hypothetical protein
MEYFGGRNGQSMARNRSCCNEPGDAELVKGAARAPSSGHVRNRQP